jgi:hypothetical protein
MAEANQLLYVTGGRNQIGNLIGDISVFDTVTESWRVVSLVSDDSHQPDPKAKRLLARSNHSLSLFMEKDKQVAYVFAGIRKKAGTDEFVTTNDLLKVTFLSASKTTCKKIRPSGPQPLPRRDHSCIVLKNRYICVFGGRDDNLDIQNLNDLVLYDTQSNEWTCIGQYGFSPSPRFSAALACSTDD